MVEVARRNAESELVAQRVHPVDGGRKRDLLVAPGQQSGNWSQVLVFTRTKSGANRLTEQLLQGRHRVHRDPRQQEPERPHARPAGFKTGTLRVLVATDIAARGLDIEELPHVVNFELPNVPEDYVHRIGRTGRAGSSGEALSLVCAEERPLLAAIEKLLTRRIEKQVVEGFEPGKTPAPAVTTPAPRGSHDGNRRGAGPGRDGRARTPAKAATPPARPGATSSPARANPSAAHNPPRAPQRPRADGGAATAALFRGPARRGS
jgi:ATP-dependent RNA helicase RhlE